MGFNSGFKGLKPIHKVQLVLVHSSFLAIRWCIGYAYPTLQPSGL